MKERQYTELFRNLLKAKGWNFRDATADEDMHDHIDGHVTICDRGKAMAGFSVDLKGDKYTSRANQGRDDCLCQYVEFLNVNGNKGWLFGKADYIAVLNEEQDGFYLIKMKELVTFCANLFGVDFSLSVDKIARALTTIGCEKNLWTSNVENAMHKLYHRRDRLDEIVTQISMDDIKALATMRI